MINKLKKLSATLDRLGHPKAAIQILKLAKPYVIKPGDNLGQIALEHGTTVSAIQRKNEMGDSTKIFPGNTLDIPESTNPNEFTNQIVAATLIGEGGSLDRSLMKKVMTIISNRAKALGRSNYSIVTDPSQFSYWNGKSKSKVLGGELGRSHPYWKEALNIVENGLVDSSLGISTHYYGHAERIPKEHRNYEEYPHWASGNCWTEIHRDSYHVYGTDVSGEWGSCQPQ